MVSSKCKEELGVVTYGIRCKLIMCSLLQSCLLCVRASRESSDEYEWIHYITFSAIELKKRNDTYIMNSFS